MLILITKIINRVKLSPIGTAAFTLVLASIGFWFNYEVKYSEFQEKIENNYLEMSLLKKEIDLVDKIINSWDKAIYKNTQLQNEIVKEILDVKNIKEENVSDYIELLTKSRSNLSYIIVQSSVHRINNKVLGDITSDINSDALYVDGFLKEQTDFIVFIFKDPVKAAETKENMKLTFERVRKFNQIDARLKLIYTSFDEVVDSFNSLVRKDKELRNRARFESNLVIACWTYVGAYIGCWIGLFFGRIRRKKNRRIAYLAKKENSEQLKNINDLSLIYDSKPNKKAP